MVLLWFLVLCSSAVGFNVDVASRVIHRRPPGSSPNSMFGFTVQLHAHGYQKMLLVGAPEDDTRRRPELVRPGSVYRCDATRVGQCREIEFDDKPNFRDGQLHQVEEKSHQWFGATLTSSRNGPIVACAPRYVSYVTAKMDLRNPVGSCYVMKTPDDINATELSPCRTSSNGYRLTGQCQAGFSAALTADGNRMFIGAPGSFYWQGRTFTIDPNENLPYYVQKFTAEGQLYTMNPDKSTMLSTTQSSAVFDDFYMGYSMTTGGFGRNGAQAVAVGVPRGAGLRGLVVIYSTELYVIRNVSGGQIGAYFGYCLASGDIDGDGRDDLIIGAPMFTRATSEGYEHGRVYVVYQGLDRSFGRNDFRTGEISKGRFGLAVTSLGDINLDGYGDVAVGAPYSGRNGRGMVFIYYGSAQGLREKYSQAIAAEDVDPNLTTFGFSLSGGLDLDRNNFTDLAVGAYKSESAIFFRARPVIKVRALIELYSYNDGLKEISLDDKSCELSNHTKVGCAKLKYCITYDAEDVFTKLKFRVTFDLDSAKKSSKRLYIRHAEGRRTQLVQNVMLTKGIMQCWNDRIYLIETIRDKLTPLAIAMSYDVITTEMPNVISPILDQTMENIHTDALNITKNCGPDKVCIPELKVFADASTINYKHLDERFDISVEVQNNGENAFEAAYYLHIPPGVSYIHMQMKTQAGEDQQPVYCSVVEKREDGGSTLRCDIGNPFQENRKVNFGVTLEVDATVTSIELDMEANSTNPGLETNKANRRHMSIKVIIEAPLLAIGASDPPELYYNVSLYQYKDVIDDRLLGPSVIHKYNIKNENPFVVQRAQIIILWPYETLNGENLMYVLTQPETVGPVQCYAEEHIDPLSLFVRMPSKFYLEKERAVYMLGKFAASASGGGNFNYSQTNDYHSSQGGFVNSGTSQSGGSSSSSVSWQASGNANGDKQHISTSYGSQEYGDRQKEQEWRHGFYSGATNDQKNSWSTTETVNKDIMNAGSSTYHGGSSDTATGSMSYVGGDADDDIGGSIGAKAALNPSNHFQTSYSEVNVGGSSGGSRGGSLNYEGQGSYAGGGSQGGATHGGNYAASAGSSSSSSYSYSSSRGSQSTGGTHYSYGSHSSGSSANWNENRDNTRRKRQAEMLPEIKQTIDKCEEKFKCGQIVCQADYLQKGQEIWIALVARYNASVLNEMTKDRAVTLSSMAIAQVIDLEKMGKPTQVSLHKAEAKTVINQQLEALSSGTIPLWVVILAAVVGALLLLLLIFALYKCGFFKRNRPSDSAERQPLNGRDEHL